MKDAEKEGFAIRELSFYHEFDVRRMKQQTSKQQLCSGNKSKNIDIR